jgi:phage terminase large subunit-like protein
MGEPFYRYHPLKGGQTRFLNSHRRVRVLLGGNGSGKSETGAYATASTVMKQKPPRENCPFWVISKSFEMVGGTAWGEKLKGYIHPRNIKWISYINKARDWPAAIGLHSGWVLEFKSWEQGRDAFQARSIGGAWFDEQFPEDVFHETFARTRDYNSPLFVTLTPIDPDSFLQTRHDEPPEDWEFFSLDLEDNRKTRGGYIDDSWIDAFIANTPEEYRNTRIRGKFAGFDGAVFKGWDRNIHVVDPFPGNMPPRDGINVRGIDFGFNNPFVCLWFHRDDDNVWTIYDEHYQAQTLISEHVKAINSRPIPHMGFVRTWADPEDAQSRAELANSEIWTSGAKKDVWPSCEAVAKALMPRANGKPRLRVTSNCKNTIREMPAYHLEKNATAAKDAADRPCKKDDHTVDVVRYVMYNEEMENGAWTMPNRLENNDSMSSAFSKVMR